jgi:hypothetical protein
MVRVLVGFGLVVVALIWVSDSQGQGFPSEKSRVEYTHMTPSGRFCRFELGAKGGEADYYWNGQRQRDKLETVGQAKGKDNSYNVYKVTGKNIWFFFPVNAVKKGTGEDYPMRLSMQGPELDRSMAIETQGMTQVRMFELSPNKPEPPKPDDKERTDK